MRKKSEQRLTKNYENGSVEVLLTDYTYYRFKPECDLDNDIELWKEIREKIYGQD